MIRLYKNFWAVYVVNYRLKYFRELGKGTINEVLGYEYKRAFSRRSQIRKTSIKKLDFKYINCLTNLEYIQLKAQNKCKQID